MAIPKKGARKIIVNKTEFLYKVSKVRSKGEWREQDKELNDTFVQYASYYDLGNVKDSYINIAIQRFENPTSSMFIKIHTLLIDGFMGPEQIITITPNFISKLIVKGLSEGWNPLKKGDYRLTLVDKPSKDREPIILQLPNMNETIQDYKNLEKPKEVKISR